MNAVAKEILQIFAPIFSRIFAIASLVFSLCLSPASLSPAFAFSEICRKSETCFERTVSNGHCQTVCGFGDKVILIRTYKEGRASVANGELKCFDKKTGLLELQTTYLDNHLHGAKLRWKKSHPMPEMQEFHEGSKSGLSVLPIDNEKFFVESYLEGRRDGWSVVLDKNSNSLGEGQCFRAGKKMNSVEFCKQNSYPKIPALYFSHRYREKFRPSDLAQSTRCQGDIESLPQSHLRIEEQLKKERSLASELKVPSEN